MHLFMILSICLLVFIFVSVLLLKGVKKNILAESRIVCSTLNTCGSREITSFPDIFDTVVIDEASQAVELSTLIPLRLGCKRLILVGDPKQLPATVFSKIALEHVNVTLIVGKLMILRLKYVCL